MSLIPYVQPPKKKKGKKLTKAQRKSWVKKKNTQNVKKVASANSAPYKGFKGGVFAKWNKKTWKVTADQINTLSKATFEDEYDTDKKRRDPSEATFTFPLYKDLMPKMDVNREIRSWRGMIGKTGYLYLGGTLFGTKKSYRLTGVNVEGVELVGGEVIHCIMKLTFTEVKRSKSRKLPKRKQKKTTKKKTTTKKKQTKKKTTTKKK